MHEEFGEFIARLSENARVSLQHAETIARSQGSPYIGTEHLLLGILAQGSSVGAKLLADAGVTLSRAEATIQHNPNTIIATSGSPIKTLSETAMLTLKMAYEQARDMHQEYLGTEHILYSILQQKHARGALLVSDMKVDRELILADLEQYFSQNHDSAPGVNVKQKHHSGKSKILETYGIDLTEKARAGGLDPVIGRDAETSRIVTILSRRTKNNPLLIGEPGVGKTAIVEGLARRIAEGDVPDSLLEAHIVQIDLAGMIAGTKYRGEFEERLKKLVAAAAQDANLVLFIDELHILVGAGAAEGSMDAANIIKPALARGELRLIGATTYDEYRKRIEKDAALTRRFQSVDVHEPTLYDAIKIVQGLAPSYEAHHQVSLSSSVIEHAVHMADRYISDRYMPDKAIDVIDEASARARALQKGRSSKLSQLIAEKRDIQTKIANLLDSEAQDALNVYEARLEALAEEIATMRAENRTKVTPLHEDHIAAAIATMTGIPVGRLHRSELAMLRKLETRLDRHIVGQNQAIQSVSRAIRRSRSGISAKNRPVGSFIFMGPSGVGKTELARVLAREVFGGDDALIKIDMSEFGEKHTTAKLIGAPAGYVGYDDDASLLEKVRRKPHSVVLFDEIEKAHRDVFHLLLQILEDGSLRDSHGRLIDFTNTIIILTSNLGAEAMREESQLGFQSTDQKGSDQLQKVHERNSQAAQASLKKFMRPEIINRFDDIVTFQALSRRDVGKIFDRMIGELSQRLVRQGLGISIIPAAKRHLIGAGFSADHGVRPLRRVIEDQVEHALAEKLIDGAYHPGDTIRVDINDNEIVLGVVREATLTHA